jgi:hypothetical protein
MYQQYRKPKKSSSGWTKLLAIVFALIVLIWGISYLSKLGDKVEIVTPEPTTNTWSISADRYVGKQVTLQWEIQSTSGSLAYAHTITLTGWDVIAVMSSKIDLGNSRGYIYAQGEVAKFDGKRFIVDLSAVGSTAEQLSTMVLPTSTNSKIFPTLALKIDMTNHSDISYSAEGNKILLRAEWFSDTMMVEWFRCETWLPEKDCDQIQKSFSGWSFVNVGGMTFTQGADNQRFARNSAGVGYRVTSPSDALIYKASSVLIPLNETYIKTLIPSAEKLCGIKAAWTPTIQKETLSSWTVLIKNSAGATCNVRIVFTESGDQMSIGSQSATSTGTKTPGNTTTTPAPPSTSVAPSATVSGYTYASTRGGYSITFSSAKISYYGINVQEDLGIDKLNCYIRLDIKDYKDRNDDAIGPSVSIYECISKEPSASIAAKAKGYIFKTNKDGSKLFFIQTVNPSWADFASKITIQ